MTVRIRATIELVLATAAAIGCVAFWLAAASTVEVSPIIAGEPSKSSVMYDPTTIVLSLVLATIAGVLAVVGFARIRRDRPDIV